ncbi:MAG: hypothetical protein GF372_12460 [Candidatus Marinimicrobia bacterium]|nr:hypothetical protein [Candidatus Neomarinimicrobiota bacterium]
MKMKRRMVDQQINEESKQPENPTMAEFEAMMYIPVSLAQLELALTGKDVGLGADGRDSREENANEKLVSQVA